MHRNTMFPANPVKLKILVGFFLGCLLGELIKENVMLEHALGALVIMKLLHKLGYRLPDNMSSDPVTFGLIAGMGCGLTLNNPAFSYDYRSINFRELIDPKEVNLNFNDIYSRHRPN